MNEPTLQEVRKLAFFRERDCEAAPAELAGTGPVPFSGHLSPVLPPFLPTEFAERHSNAERKHAFFSERDVDDSVAGTPQAEVQSPVLPGPPLPAPDLPAPDYPAPDFPLTPPPVPETPVPDPPAPDAPAPGVPRPDIPVFPTPEEPRREFPPL